MNRGPTDAVAAQNLTLMEETAECTEDLPAFFVVRHTPTTADNYAVVVQCCKSPNWPHAAHVWNMSLVENPKEFLGQSMMVEHYAGWPNLNSQMPFLVERFSRNDNEHKKLYKTTAIYSKFAIRQAHGTLIPVLDLNKARLVLPSRFTNLHDNQNDRFRFELRLGVPIEPDSIRTLREMRQQAIQLAELEAARMIIRMQANTNQRQVTVQAPRPRSLPQHIVNQYLESLVAKQEACPITMAPLDKDSACLTPCGHALDSSSAKHWISNEHSCPVCRQECSESDLLVWTA